LPVLPLADTDPDTSSDTITINASDSLGDSAASKNISVTVNPANGPPVIAAPATLIIGVGQNGAMPGVSISETGNTNGETFTVTLADTNGHLSTTGGQGTITGSGTANIQLSGTLAQVNTDLGALIDNDATAGSDTITINATDSLGGTATHETIGATVNGVPMLNAPVVATIGVGQSRAIGGVSISESGNTGGTETFAATLTDTNGILNVTGAGVTNNDSSSLTITGSLNQVNADLTTLTDTDSVAPSDTITLNATDTLGNSAPAKTIAVTVNAAPIIAAPTTATIGVNQPQAIDGVSIPESGTTAGETFTVTLADIHGPLSVTAGAGVSGNGTNSLQITGQLANVNSELSSLSDTDGTTGSDMITLNAGDGFGNTDSPQTISVTVNGIPVTNSPANASVTQNTATTISGVSVSESGNTSTSGEAFSATVSDSNGNLSANGASGNGTHVLAFSNLSLTTLNSDLATLSDADPDTSSDTIVINATDSFGNSAAAKTISVTVITSGAPPVLSGGGNTVSWTIFAAPTVVDSGLGLSDTEIATINGATIAISSGFLTGDRLGFANQNSIGGSYNAATGVLTLSGTATVAQYQAALESVTFFSTNLTPTNGGVDPTRTITWQVNDGIASSNTVTSAVDVSTVNGKTFILTTGIDKFTGTLSNDLFIAASNTLSQSDVLKGNGGTDTIALSGGGTFNLGLPSTISGIQFIRAFEGQGATAETLTLRKGTSFTVDVVADLNGSDTSPTITIIGANDNDTINLGPGNDTVTLGGKTETVNSGGGNNTFNVTATTIGATINGGNTGSNTLVVNGGGKVAMGASITDIANVDLVTTTNLTANAITGMRVHGSAAGGDVITLGDASQSVVSGGPNEIVIATAAQAGAQVSGLGANSTLDVTGGGSANLNANTDVATVLLKSATALQLNGMQFIHAIGSSGADIITAGAINQTLTGGSGVDILNGFAGGSDIFSDTALGLKGDTIGGFVSSDSIDVTNLAFAGATLKATPSGGNTLVTVASGATNTRFTMVGSFPQAGFNLKSDGATGTLITHS
jgi:hypothetical protein